MIWFLPQYMLIQYTSLTLIPKAFPFCSRIVSLKHETSSIILPSKLCFPTPILKSMKAISVIIGYRNFGKVLYTGWAKSRYDILQSQSKYFKFLFTFYATYLKHFKFLA